MLNTEILKRALVLGALVLLLSSAPFVVAQGDDDGSTTTTEEEDDDTTTTDDSDDDEEYEPEEHRDPDGTVWIQTDLMTVRLDSGMPIYQFWYTADDNGTRSRFMVGYSMIVEFDDVNGDGVYQTGETLGFVPLAAFEWLLQTGAVTNPFGFNQEVFASYTKGGLSSGEWDDDWFEDWMPGYHGPGDDDNESSSALSDDDDDHENESDDDFNGNFTRYEGMTLRFYAHIYMDNYTGNVTDDEGVQASYTVLGGVELKIDIEIGNFPFVSNTSKIAILNYLREDVAYSQEYNYHFRLHEYEGDDDVESEDDSLGNDLGEEFHDDDDDEIQEISLVDGSSNITRGFYRWVDKAVVTATNGSQYAVDVGASYWTNGEALLLFMAYPNFNGGSIVHDPSMGLVQSASPVTTIPGISVPTELLLGLSAVGAIAIVAVFALRRR